MKSRYVVVFCTFLVPTVSSQTLEERVERLERRVQELRGLHGIESLQPSTLPSALIGNDNVRWGYPGGRGTLLVKEYFVISHDNVRKVPEWVTYHLRREYLAGDAERTDDFRPDPELPNGERSELADYRNSGYDRGHMAPAADFKRSRTAMSETFLLSNMSPQRPNLNRQIWARLEDQVRDLSEAHGSIWVFTGPLYLDEDGRQGDPSAFVGPNRVAIPTHFYKAILCEHTTGTREVFAFIMANQLNPLSGEPHDYLVTVDRVEMLSGLDFFSVLQDAEENGLESTVATNWPIQ